MQDLNQRVCAPGALQAGCGVLTCVFEAVCVCVYSAEWQTSLVGSLLVTANGGRTHPGPSTSGQMQGRSTAGSDWGSTGHRTHPCFDSGLK